MNSISISSVVSRVPNRLTADVARQSLFNTQRELLEAQIQLATGKRINRPSDDPLATSTVTGLDDEIERRDQRLRNLQHAEAVMNTVDVALDEATGLLLEAKTLGLSQMGSVSDTDTRRQQAAVVDNLLSALTTLANRESQGIHLFGGKRSAEAPMVGLREGLQYRGSREGLVNELGLDRAIPINLTGPEAFGSLSARVEGDSDLDPRMNGNTRLDDLAGARSLGIARSSLAVDVNGTELTVDLTDADRVEDVVDRLQAAIQTVDAGATVSIDATTGNRFAITPSGGFTVTISDPEGPAAAADLGLEGTFPPDTVGADVNPRLTELTPLSDIDALTVPLGSIRVGNGSLSREVDLSGAENVQDVLNAINGLDLGVRAEINPEADRIDVVNELSGALMSIGEVSGGTTATELGIRSLMRNTPLSELNRGRGVEIRSGSVDPQTGLPDPSRDLDFRITAKDGTTFDVDLAGAMTIGDVIDAINTEAVNAGLTVPAPFNAGLASDGNGIELTDGTAAGTTTIEALNGSFAAENLGILMSSSSATLTGEDRATVAAESAFTHLIDLREALLNDDSDGIAFAVSQLETDLQRVAEARGTNGIRTRRVRDAATRQEDLNLQDLQLRSELQDLDYGEASIRFTSLQQQLQAALITTSELQSTSLLDFLR